MSLSLPKPVNTYAGEDELRQTNGSADANGGAEEDVGEYKAPRMSDRYKVGMIYPPKEMRNVIDKTSNHVSKSPSPALLEAKIKDQLKTDPKFAFLNDEDPYHAYYKYMIEKIREDAEDVAKGVAPAPTAGASGAAGGDAENEKVKNLADQVTAYEPKELEFKVDLPGVTAQDLDILRLTALFHARRGRSFLSSLSVREGRNYQFDFLRPTHSLFGYYNRMVESYQKVMNPPPGLIETLVRETADPEIKWKTLEEARNRAEWERGKRKREDERQKEQNEEAEAMGLIDWQDFVVVETIEFTQTDLDLELPPPTNVEKLKTMSMAEKRMASMVMEETGAGPTGTGQVAPDNDATEEMDMEEDDETEEVKLQRLKEEQEQARARDVQRAAMQSRGVKIRTDYTPKGIQRGGGVTTAKCPNCGQSIPENELSEHMRIELLDPKWKEQKRQLEMRRNQSLQMAQGTDVSASLRNLASQRTDLFGDDMDEAERKRKEEEANKKRRERERIIWDGHTNSAQRTTDTFQSQFTLDDQIKKMHSRMGLSESEQLSAVGPQAGPGIASTANPNETQLPPALAASLPTPDGGTAFSGATISAEPTGPSTREYISSPYQAPPAPPSSSSGPSIHPSRMAAMQHPGDDGSSSPAPPQGQVRPREDEPDLAAAYGFTAGEGGSASASGSGEPAPKRAKVEKPAFGQLYNEIDWMSLHPEPITLAVQLPVFAEKPEWKLDGSVLDLPSVPVNTPFAAIRDRIKRALEAELPISRMRIEYEGKVMNNQSSLASVNIGDGDMVVLSLKKK